MANNEKALKLHEEWQGKIETVSKCPIKTREDLALRLYSGRCNPVKLLQKIKMPYTPTQAKRIRWLLYPMVLLSSDSEISALTRQYR